MQLGVGMVQEGVSRGALSCKQVAGDTPAQVSRLVNGFVTEVVVVKVRHASKDRQC